MLLFSITTCCSDSQLISTTVATDMPRCFHDREPPIFLCNLQRLKSTGEFSPPDRPPSLCGTH
jgi:hypothetical protein